MPILTDDEREGTTLADGKYALQRVIGRGGMATVFEALHTWTGRKVAVKVLHSSLTADAELSRKYLQEARAATALDHPNVVEVLDMGREESDGTVYIVFELLRGESLRDRLDRLHTLTTLEIATLLVPILDALVVAHQRGIVHRDLKPDNIFLQEDGRGGFRPKLLDFGIAKMDEAHGAHKHTGPVSGTVEYLSPERAQGLKTGPATDVWSMGVVIYECLTGSLPFERESITATLLSIVQCPAPSLRDATDIPPATAELVELCLAKDLKVRFPDAFALREALIRTVGAALAPVTLPSLPSIPTPSFASNSIVPPEPTSHSDAPPSSGVRARSKRRVGVALLAAVVALLVVLGVWRSGNSGAGVVASSTHESPSPTFAPQTVLVAPREPAQVGVVVVSPDPTTVRESESIGPRPSSDHSAARERVAPAQPSSVMSPRATSSSDRRPQRGANGSLILD